MDSLNNDIVTQILANLPVKSVLQFRSVCKSWRTIIDSSTFRKLHLQNQSNDDEDILFLQFSNKEYTWELSSTLSLHNWRLGRDFPPRFHEYFNVNFWGTLTIDGPINGLICMYDEYPSKRLHLRLSVSIAICNPCLGEVKILPVSDYLIGCETWNQPFDYRHVGFGFDCVTKEYKVVQLTWPNSDEGVHVEVYSGITNSWKVLVTGMLDSNLFVEVRIKTSYNTSGAAAYWLCSVTKDEDDDVKLINEVILSFDMHSEVFKMISLPAEFEDIELFANDDDSLVLFAYMEDLNRMEMWEMETTANNRGWEMETNKNRGWTHVREIQFGSEIPLQPIALWKYGVIFKSCSPSKKSYDLIFYDYSREKEKKRVELPIASSGCRRLLLEYKSSLNSLETCLI